MHNACSIEHLERLCRYIKQRREGEFIKAPNWSKSYLGFGSISQRELDFLCQVSRGFLLRPNESIYHTMGEIIFTIRQ